MQKATSVIDSELLLLETRFTHPERFVKDQTFKSDLHIIPKSKDLGIVALAEIVESLYLSQEIFNNEDKLLDNQDLAFLLKVSYRTLQRYRDSGQLRYFLVRRKTFYRMADVKDFIQSYASKKEIVMFNKGIEEGTILK